MSEYIRNQILGIADNFKALASMAGDIEQVARICTDTLKAGNKIMFCGNGGSAADSQHLAAELVGRYKLNRPAMNALALTVDTSILTAVGNDYGYETVFSRQLEGVGRPGDLLVGLSTSGNSRNIVLAMELARRMGVRTVALTGRGGGEMKEVAEFCIAVPSDATNNIQEMHIAVGHLVCELVEREIYGGYVHRIEDFRLVPGILNLCRQAKEKGYLVLVATNQSGIGRGMFSEDDFERLTEYMRGVFRSSGAEIAGVFHCPSADDGHPDRKPNPGLFLKAAAAHGLDMKACVSVGDRERDIRAALAAGVGRNFLFSAEDVPTLATARVETLEEVAARL